jgi:hypothetical protein
MLMKIKHFIRLAYSKLDFGLRLNLLLLNFGLIPILF